MSEQRTGDGVPLPRERDTPSGWEARNPTTLDWGMPTIGEDVYLGDGVYASFDGRGIWLRGSGSPVFFTQGHFAALIALEPAARDAFVKFARLVASAISRREERANAT